MNVQVATASRQLKMQPGAWDIRARDEDTGVIHSDRETWEEQMSIPKERLNLESMTIPKEDQGALDYTLGTWTLRLGKTERDV